MNTKLTIADLKLMVENELLRLAAGKRPFDEGFGICYQLTYCLNEHKSEMFNGYLLVSTLANGWMYHTGCKGYPVPFSHYPGHYPEQCNIWFGFSGCYRRNLCEYLAGKVRACSERKFKEFTVNLAF